MTFFQCKGFIVGVMNLMGRLFMPVQLDCPFQKAEQLLKESQAITPIMIVDFHAEIAAEKQALGHFLDGKVSAVVGTHTHVQTTDAVILPQGTAYLTDLGMGGSLNSMIGAKKEALLYKLMTQMPVRHEVSSDAPYVLSGAVITINPTTGKSLAIETVYIVDNEPL
jgi:metallophosphoesterase (TIGR00282 family)